MTSHQVLSTHDGGAHWQAGFRASYLDIAYFHAFDARHVVAEARDGEFYSSDDGGAHWRHHHFGVPGALTIVFFLDSSNGWSYQVVGQPTVGGMPPGRALYRTTDGGIHWTEAARVDDAHPTSHGLSLSFLPNSSPIFSDSRHGVLGTLSPDGVARVYVTSDGGDFWRLVTVPVPPEGEYAPPSGKVRAYDLHMFGNRGFIGMSPANGGSAYASITSDGGLTWSSPRRVPGDPIALDAQHWWVLTANGLERTADAGLTWQQVAVHMPPGLTLAQFQAVDANVLWGVANAAGHCFQNLLVGDYCAYPVRSTDGGGSWTAATLPPGS